MESEKNIVVGKDIYIDNAKKDFLGNVNFIGETTQVTEDPIEWKQAEGKELELNNIVNLKTKEQEILGDMYQATEEAIEWKEAEGNSIDLSDISLTETKNVQLEGDMEQNNAILPEEYQQVEYIESTGTQYINVIPSLTINQKIKYATSLKYTQLVNDRQLIGNHYGRWFGINENGYLNIGNDAISDINGLDWHDIVYEYENNIEKIIIDNETELNRIYSNTNIVNGGINIFACTSQEDNNPSYSCKMQLKIFRIYIDDELIRNLVPCYRKSDNVIGMYDLVNDVFYINNGEENFLKGADLLLPTPDYPQPITTVTGDVNVKLQNKNLAGFRDLTYTKANLNVVAKNGKITLNGTNNGSNNVGDYFIDSESTFTTRFDMGYFEAGTYNWFATSSGNVTFPTSNSGFAVYLRDESDASLSWFARDGNTGPLFTYSRTFTINKPQHLYYQMWINKSNFVFDNFTILTQIEEGSTATDYIEHQEQNYPLTLGAIEFVGNDTYGRDYIYKNLVNGKWYKKALWGKVVLDGTNNKFNMKHNSILTDTRGLYMISLSNKNLTVVSSAGRDNKCIFSNKFYENLRKSASQSIDYDCMWWESRTQYVYFSLPYTNLTDANNYLKEQYNAGTPVELWYFVDTPTDTELTEPTLIEQLNALYDMYTYLGITHVDIEGLGIIKFNYDGYDGMPSPEHPSEIEVVSGEQVVRVGNKNLFDLEKYPFIDKVAYTDNGLQSWSNYCGIVEYFPVQENTAYTFSNNYDRPITYGLVFYDKDKNQLSSITNATTTFTTPENCKYIRFAINSSELPTWVQIEYGFTKTNNIEHASQEYPVLLSSNQLYNYKDTTQVGEGITVDDEGWITATYDNSEGSSLVFNDYFTNNLNLKPDTNYNIITEIKSVNGTGTLLITNNNVQSQFTSDVIYNLSELNNNSKVASISKTKSNLSNSIYGLRSYVRFTAGQSGSITFRLSVLEDTTITADNFDYQPYYTQQTELAGNETARDYIYKKDGKWWKKSYWIEKTFTGNENFRIASNHNEFYYDNTEFYTITSDTSPICLFSNYFKSVIWNNYWTKGIVITSFLNRSSIVFRWNAFTTVEEIKAWFKGKYDSGNPVVVRTLRATPTDTELTDTTLIEQLDNIENLQAYTEVTYVNTEGELAPIIKFKYDGYDGFPTINEESEIYSVTGEQTVSIMNNNEFNMLDYQPAGTVYEEDEVTFEMNNDGTIDIYGIAENDAEWYLVKSDEPVMSLDGNYTLQLLDNTNTNVFIYLINNDMVVAMTNSSDNFTYTGDIDTIMIRVNKGTEVETTLYPILTKEDVIGAPDSYDKANQQIYTIDLGDVVLNGNNNVRDTFTIEFTEDDTGYKNITKLYHNKNFEKYVFNGNGSEIVLGYRKVNTNIFYFTSIKNKIKLPANNQTLSNTIITCNYLDSKITPNVQWQDDTKTNIIINTGGVVNIQVFKTEYDTTASLDAKLKSLYDAGTPMYVIYQLATPEKIQISDTNLIQDMENLLNATTYRGVNKIHSTVTVEIEYTVKYGVNYDFYIDENDKFFHVPKYDIKFLFSSAESNIPDIAENTETTVKIAGKDGDEVLSSTYEPLELELVCYTDENLSQKEKIAEISKVTKFLESIKHEPKNLALLSTERMMSLKYFKNLTTLKFPKSVKFTIPLKSSNSYTNGLYPTRIFGNGEEYSDTITETGAIITINGPVTNPVIFLNGYEMKYNNTILEGNKLVIDTGNSTATHYNKTGAITNAAVYYNHEYPKIVAGINTVDIKSGVGYDKQVVVEWYDLKN